MARAGNGPDRRPRQSVKKCALLRKASQMSCLNDASYDDDEDEAEHSDDTETATTTTTPPPHPRPVQPGLSTHSSSSSARQTTTTPAKPNKQPQSLFFTHLPLEIRRLVYAQLFGATNPLMKMHVHAACDGARLTTTPCRYQQVPAAATSNSTRDDDDAADDPMQTDPWPGWRGRNQPPRWFWHAWGLRLRWGPHWTCQAAAMRDWEARADGTSVDFRGQRGLGWMGMFLTCRQMYGEAIEYLFESTTLIFTASEDAYRFFVQNPHEYQARIRNVDLSFEHFKDHLFLRPIVAPAHPLDGGRPGLATTATATAPVAEALWRPLVACLRGPGLPELRSLRVRVAPPASWLASPPSEGEGPGPGFWRVLMDGLWDWEREGYGWVEEQADGVVYLEKGGKKGRGLLLLEEEEGGNGKTATRVTGEESEEGGNGKTATRVTGEESEEGGPS